MRDAQSFRLTVVSDLGSRSGPPRMGLWGELFYLPGKFAQFLLEGGAQEEPLGQNFLLLTCGPCEDKETRERG